MTSKKTSTTRTSNTPILDRRQFLSGGIAGAVSLSLKSLATGLPASFLLGGITSAHAEDFAPKSLILGMSDDGESVNAYAPGSFGSGNNDPRSVIERANSSDLGTGSLGAINGTNVTVNDFANSAMIQMGDTQVEAARYWTHLPQSLLDSMSVFNLRTHANGHPDGPAIHRVNGALLSADGRNTEEIQSAIMQELLAANAGITSVLSTPLVLNGGGGRLSTLTNNNVAISRYSPLDIKNLFLSSTAADIENMNKVYDNTIDAIYNSVKSSGTPAQKRYLDQYASSRLQATVLGDRLGDLLSEVNDDTKADQARAAVALAKVNIAPVIVIRYAYSGDNHRDSTLAEETSFTIEQMNNLTTLWNLIQSEGLQDQINFATYDIFGRTLGRNSSGGRDHHRSSCTNMMVGSNIKAGVIGGLETWDRSGHRLLQATGINSTTGLSANPDITGDDTLFAYCRTLMASVGISEERINARLPNSKTVMGAFV